MKCRHCGSNRVVKNGHITRWKGSREYRQQFFKCMACGKSMFGDKVFTDVEQPSA